MSAGLNPQLVNLSSGPLAYYVLGNKGKIPLLFIHGHRSDALRFQGLLKILAQDTVVFAPDLPGCGQSPPYRQQWHSMAAYARTLQELIEKIDLDQFILAGGSMGGVIALQLYPLIAPRVSKMILFATPLGQQFFLPPFRYLSHFRFLLRAAIKSKIIPFLGQSLINCDSCMHWFYRHLSPIREAEEEVIKFEIRQWRAMRFRIWLETNYDLLGLNLLPQLKPISIPLLFLETRHNPYYDQTKNLAALKKIAPHLEVVFLDWQTHIPRGELDPGVLHKYQKYFRRFLKEK